MESYGTPQTTQGVAKIVGCHPQTVGHGSIAEYGEVKLGPT